METNFKVDVPSFALGYSAGKKKGGGGEGGIAGFHKVQFFNDDRTTLLYTVFVPHGSSAMYAGDTPVSTENEVGILLGFEPAPTNITADFDTYAVYEFVGTLDETSWEKIAELSADGTAQNYFAVGDTKMIHVEGKVGTLSVNGDYGVYIIGFDHNEELEGKGIHFGTFKTAVSNGKHICLVDKNYDKGSTDGTKYFSMNHWMGNNYGGWQGCDMRYDILGSTDVAPSGYGASGSKEGKNPTTYCAKQPVTNTLMAALPSDLRAVMKPMTKYTDGKGNSSNIGENVTVTVDYLPFLAEFEVLGWQSNANKYEQNYQKQYDYFALHPNGTKYKHSSNSDVSHWWQRSAFNGNQYSFVAHSSSAYFYNRADQSSGLAPIFKV